MSRLRIGDLAKLIAQCWDTAEKALRSKVKQYFPDRDEEIITELFHGELDKECNRVSAKGAVEKAFRSDLRRAFPDISEAALSKIGRGLVATVHFHPRPSEARTGGDFGIAFIRPDVRCLHSTLKIDHSYRRGLLCQAKILRRDSSWGRLTTKQLGVFAERIDYLSLLLYSYADQNGARRELDPFKWQLTTGTSVDDIVGWLRSGNFPNLRPSRDILIELAHGRIGTDDDKLISEFIALSVRPSLEIRIHWRDTPKPGDTLNLHGSNAVRQQYVYLRR